MENNFYRGNLGENKKIIAINSLHLRRDGEVVFLHRVSKVDGRFRRI